jgi:ketosteroid isomerase-like protein
MGAMEDRGPVQTVYDAAETADLAAIESVLADDVVLYEPVHHPAVLMDTEQSGQPGVWRGRDEAMVGIGKVFGALRLTGVDLEGIVADGSGTVVGLLEVKGTDTGGNPYTMPMAEVFKVSDGKVTEIRAFYFDIAELGSNVIPAARIELIKEGA